MELKGKVFILTGAKRVGQDVAKALGERGANLAISYNSSIEDAQELKKECESVGSRAEIFKADLSKSEDIGRLVDETLKKFGAVDGLIHMAANYPKTPIGGITLEDFDKTMHIIAASTLLLGQKIGKEMQENEGDVKGKIIFFSDWSVLRSPYPNYIVYNGAKSAVESFTKSLARQFAPSITVNAIAPGPILRPPDLSDDDNEEVMKKTPLQKWGGGDEIEKAVLYLLDADFVTGVVLPVDGGRSIA
ncbi:MAG: SDR family oxidoreductase [Candidatus Daviesbacteria bacterium]|nr:SDR family oxidoreductase [Candidatus Daviesbacteria bacterium]